MAGKNSDSLLWDEFPFPKNNENSFVPGLFTDYEAVARQEAAETAELEKEKRLQLALLDIKKELGKNAVLKGMNLLDGATAKALKEQIGGHRK